MKFLVFVYILFGIGFFIGTLSSPGNQTYFDSLDTLEKFVTFIMVTGLWPLFLGVYVGKIK